MKIPYKMETGYDCGPRALSSATSIPYEKIIEEWQWRDYNDFRDNAKDTPWHHFNVLQKLKIPFKRYKPIDVIEKRCAGEKTLILFHDPASPFLSQHWVLLKHVADEEIHIDLGNGKVGCYTPETFLKYADASWPIVVYTVGSGDDKNTWYQDLLVWVTNLFL
jgi:hypothetical protein